jgi:hypothetical protein
LGCEGGRLAAELFVKLARTRQHDILRAVLKNKVAIFSDE